VSKRVDKPRPPGFVRQSHQRVQSVDHHHRVQNTRQQPHPLLINFQKKNKKNLKKSTA
jgi:hypothetical protein